MHVHEPLWRSFFDGLFCFASALLAIFFGAALANVIRGVPIGADSYFFLPLWTTGVRAQSGHSRLVHGDWRVVALLALSMHGALYLSLKTEGDLERRARVCAGRLWPFVCVGTVLAIPATILARPDSLGNYRIYPAAFLAPIAVVLGLVAIAVALRRRSEIGAFLASCVYLAAMLCGAAAGLFPVLLPSTSSSGREHHDRQRDCWSSRPARRTGVVDLRHDAGDPLFQHCLLAVPGKVSQYADTYGH